MQPLIDQLEKDDSILVSTVWLESRQILESKFDLNKVHLKYYCLGNQLNFEWVDDIQDMRGEEEEQQKMVEVEPEVEAEPNHSEKLSLAEEMQHSEEEVVVKRGKKRKINSSESSPLKQSVI